MYAVGKCINIYAHALTHPHHIYIYIYICSHNKNLSLTVKCVYIALNKYSDINAYMNKDVCLSTHMHLIGIRKSVACHTVIT